MKPTLSIPFFIFFPLLFTPYSFSQDFQTFTYFDVKTANMKGSVKSIHEYSYIATDTNGYIEKLEFGYNTNTDFPIVVHFDPEGRVIHEKVSYGDTLVYTQFDYTYDKKGKLSVLLMTYPETGKKYAFNYLYDSKSRLTSSGIGTDAKKHRTRYYYFNDPETIRKDHLDTNNNVKLRFEYVYEKGRKIEFRHFKSGYFYAKNKGDFLNDVKNTDSMVLMYKLNYDYDGKGNAIHEIRTTVEWGFPPDTTFCTFNESNQIIGSKKFDKKRHPSSVYDYQYDQHGNITKFEFISNYEEESFIESHDYLYDSTGNWIRKFVYEDGVLIQIIERKITYY